MPRKTTRSSGKGTSKRNRSEKVVTRTQTRTVVAAPKPVTDIVVEKRVITTEPEVEIRRPATLAAALTEPTVAVVKPRTRVQKVERKVRRAA